LKVCCSEHTFFFMKSMRALVSHKLRLLCNAVVWQGRFHKWCRWPFTGIVANGLDSPFKSQYSNIYPLYVVYIPINQGNLTGVLVYNSLYLTSLIYSYSETKTTLIHWQFIFQDRIQSCRWPTYSVSSDVYDTSAGVPQGLARSSI
jgi:hypothetical protein